ncbi:unnamed protein product [Soboliphyme baturini]|uniref:ZP domain-containing protein n=1 Tax=Soboliphyme baturini TaxID=241478 RepID=A0A183IMJ2_9BILA|nr:unnamed protein product [Soboliphyme baturini]
MRKASSNQLCKVLLILCCGMAITTTTAEKGSAAYVSTSDKKRVQVFLDCGSQYITINLKFNSSYTPWFNDWILVGNSDRPACRIKGDGGLNYLIEVPIFNDPCGLQRPNTNTFETVLSITRLPNVILDGDETVKIRCIYGPPAIGTPIIPEIPPPEAILPYSTLYPPFEVTEKAAKSDLSSWHVYLVTAIVLSLILAIIICCCLYFCMKTRKSRLDNRRKFFRSAPPGAKLSADDIGRFWWTARSSASNDPLMSHNLMLVNNSTVSKPLSVNSDYANAAMSSASRTSSLSTPGVTRLSPQLLGYADSQVSSAGTTCEHGTVNRQQVAPLDDIASSSNRDDRSSAVYASISCQKKTMAKGSGHGADGRSPSSSTKAPTEMIESVSQLYSSRLATEFKRKNRDISSEVTQPSYATAPDSNSTPVEEYVRVVSEAIKLGTVELSDEDGAKWARTVRGDCDLQELLVTCRTYEDFKVISCISHYKQLFPREKWEAIVKILSHVALRRDKCQRRFQRPPWPSVSGTTFSPAASGSPLSAVEKTAAVTASASSVKGTDSSGFHSFGSTPLERIFTRDSYCQVEDEMQNVQRGEQRCLEKGTAELFESNSQFRGLGEKQRLEMRRRTTTTGRDDAAEAASGKSSFPELPSLRFYHYAVGNKCFANDNENESSFSSSTSVVNI